MRVDPVIPLRENALGRSRREGDNKARVIVRHCLTCCNSLKLGVEAVGIGKE